MVNNNNITLALVLGSGIDLYDELITDKTVFSVEIKGVHKKLVYSCSMNGKDMLVFKGRRHYYEGFTSDDILTSVRLAAEYGAKNIMITNAAGGLNDNFNEGDLMIITSHIDFNKPLPKPLTGNKKLNPYSKELRDKFKKACTKSEVKVHEGSYGFYPGPTYETRAEIRMQKKTGLDAAGMSTIPEVYEAASLGMNVLAVSVITNILNENNPAFASHESVLLSAQKASAKLNKAISNLINELN